jgi:L-malate glycosyltransferase
MNPVRFYRLARWLYLHRIPLLPRLFERFCILICNCCIPAAAEIGPGFQSGHYGVGIVIHPHARIGKNVFVDGGVTIGGNRQSARVPRIGDNVYIGAGARILGDIEVGEGCLIGPNAVVTKSVPPGSIVSTAAVRVTPMPARVNVYDLTGWPPELKQESDKHQESNPNGRPLRIFYFVDSLNFGGSENQMCQMALRLDRNRFQVTVGCLKAEGAYRADLEAAHIRIVEFRPRNGIDSSSGLWSALRLAQFLRREGFDAVQTFDLYSNLLGVPAAWLARTPLRISNRRDLGNYEWYTPRNRVFLRRIVRLSHIIAVNSEAIRNRVVQVDGYPDDKIRVVRNGIDIESFSQVVANRPQVLPHVGPGDKVVCMVANMNNETKGHADLIEAARTVCDRVPSARFVLVGDGRQRAELERRARDLGLEAKITFIGHRADVPQILKCSDLSVLPSWAEGLPNVVMESVAVGTPVVATRVGGTPEIIDHAVSGLLVPPRDPAALAAAIIRMLEVPKLAASMAATALERLRERFSFSNVIETLEEIYSQAREDDSQ